MHKIRIHHAHVPTWLARALAALWLGLVAALLWPGVVAAAWQVLVSTDSGFNTPASYANLRTVNFNSGAVAAEGSRLTVTSAAGSGGWFVSAGSVSTSGSGPALTGFSGNAAVLDSGSSGTPASLSIQFNGGGTSYFAVLLGMSVKQDNTQWVRVTYGSGTQVVLYNCKTASDANCLAKYVPTNWLSDLISGILGIFFGSNNYASVYLSYTPPAGESITKVEFFDNVCSACAGLFDDGSQNLWVDNLSYVDATVAPHHLEVTTTSATASAGTAVTFTIRACADATCSSLYTTGMSGTIAVTGTGVTTTYPSGTTYTIPARSSFTTITASMTPAGTVTVALSAPSRTPTGAPAVWCGMGTSATNGGSCTLTVSTPLHHFELISSAASTVTCVPVTFTIKACADAGCGSLYTSAVSGTLGVSGTNVSAYSSAFSFSTGSATVSTNLGISGAGNTATATASLSGYTPTPTAATPVYYGMGASSGTAGGSQSITLNKAGFLFDVSDHAAESTQAVTVTAVQTATNTSVCTPAFASVDKAVNFKCSHTNPASGTQAVRIQDKTIAASYQALNAGNAPGSSCDATGADVTLRFNASGAATINLKYADVGLMGLTATYTSGVMTMSGTDSFVSSPYDFAVAVTTAGNIKAGNSFSLSVTARNSNGTATPNFGRETAAEGVTMGFVRTSPRFAGAVTGTLGGALGAFSGGVATSSAMSYTEAGMGDIGARLSSGSYLSSGKVPAGSTRGSWVSCASENGTCTVPTGATAVVSYGANGLYSYKTNQSGAVSCSNASFGDPIVGVAKSCWYVATGGSNTAVTGTAGPFIPHHFTVSTTNACTTFTYSGQPATVVVKAFNAVDSVNPIQNYDGSDATSSYNAARQVTLSDTGGATNGSWSGTNVVPASAFSAGVATWGTAAYTFTTKATIDTTLTLRAVDTDGVSSLGYAEGTLKQRSGRIQFFNAYGSEKSDLHVPVQVLYWSGKAWLTNSADNGCTVIPAASIARSNYVDARGSTPSGAAAWTTASSTPITITSGVGDLVLLKPTLTSGGSGVPAGTVEVAMNLGASAADTACRGSHPSVTGANLPWLRAVNGSCSAASNDPSASISFGVFGPETRKIIHVHDMY